MCIRAILNSRFCEHLGVWFTQSIRLTIQQSSLTSSVCISQLSADNSCIITIPGVVTHCPPLIIDTHLHSTLILIGASHQTNITISTITTGNYYKNIIIQTWTACLRNFLVLIYVMERYHFCTIYRIAGNFCEHKFSWITNTPGKNFAIFIFATRSQCLSTPPTISRKDSAYYINVETIARRYHAYQIV